MNFLGSFFASFAKFTVRIERLLGDHRARPTRFWLLRSERSGKQHTMQLWLYAEPAGFRYEIRQLYGARGRVIRACTLESGSYEKEEAIACSKGNQAFDKLMG